MKTFNGKTIQPGDSYCRCLGYNYLYEDAQEFLGFLIGKVGPEGVLNALYSEEYTR